MDACQNPRPVPAHCLPGTQPQKKAKEEGQWIHFSVGRYVRHQVEHDASQQLFYMGMEEMPCNPVAKVRTPFSCPKAHSQ